ncbi:MAG: hypothetical protein IKM61_00150 [Eubacteriaceae bacterium]|nr:hypothetical protein [Eubacteriaceae bacterium]
MHYNHKLSRIIENADGNVSVKKSCPIDIWMYVFVLCVGILSLFLSTYLILSFDDVLCGIVGYVWSAICIKIGWVTISMELFSFEFIREGIRIKYPLKKIQVIEWDEFQQICICYNGSTTRGERKAFSVICLVKNGEKKNHLYRWNTFHYKNVITIYYSDEILTELKKYCPYDVVDLRKTTRYKL